MSAGARNRSATAIAAIERTISADSTERMRRSRSVISPWVVGMVASGAERLQSLLQASRFPWRRTAGIVR